MNTSRAAKRRAWGVGLSTWIAAATFAPLPASHGDPFWDHWGDGKAEVNTYTYTQNRYGQERHGRAVLIFVTETHSEREKVKIEGDVSRVPEDERYPVLKLHALREFQTGIYPYHAAVTAFSRLDEGGTASKVSAGVQEWCGQAYHQVVRDGNKMVESLHSYLGGEGDRTWVHRLPSGAIFEDALPIRIRELNGSWMAPGETRDFTAVPSLLASRFDHRPLALGTLRLAKSGGMERLFTVVGRLDAVRWVAETPRGETYTYLIEKDWPHRLLRWSSDRGEAAVLTGSKRLAYWEMNKEGDEILLKEIGLSVPSSP